MSTLLRGLLESAAVAVATSAPVTAGAFSVVPDVKAAAASRAQAHARDEAERAITSRSAAGLAAALGGRLKDDAALMMRVLETVVELNGTNANQVSFAAAGGIPRLVALLRGELVGNADVMKWACRAVANETCNNEANQFSFAAAGGIPRLVALLRGGLAGNADVMKWLCCVVADVTLDDANAASFAVVGGIPPLVALLGGALAGNADVIKWACWAVRHLTANNDAHAASFAAAGGIPPLTAATAVCSFPGAEGLLARFDSDGWTPAPTRRGVQVVKKRK